MELNNFIIQKSMHLWKTPTGWNTVIQNDSLPLDDDLNCNTQTKDSEIEVPTENFLCVRQDKFETLTTSPVFTLEFGDRDCTPAY